MKNIKITVGTCAYLSHAFKYVCSQYGVTSCQGEHKMKIRSLSVLVAMILLIGCYSPVAKVDAAEKNYKKEYQKIVKESYKENPGCTYNPCYFLAHTPLFTFLDISLLYQSLISVLN